MISCAKTDVGIKRKVNQDAIFYSDTAVGKLPNLYLVADGMGGELAGDYASAKCVETIINCIKKSKETEPVRILEEAIQTANNLIYAESKSDPGKAGMGTTLVMATIIDGHLFVANVGDSRLYVANSSKVLQVTKDHSVVAELVRTGELDEDDARTDKRKNMITRAVGAESAIAADYFDVALKGREHILLCSDGLTNMVSDKEILSILKSADSIEDRATRLVELANSYGGKDNISVIIVE
ncbi:MULTISPECIES: Stp1/IreP family PP2C-type Ser/Thr phosphatase [Pseudobutyrivibrio]|jgi:protein phosphatase|uniref:Serine/threonine-protein phosphatase n=2 Tax=Pseudobutyrivibrio TaxID=46205 RepID=A0A2G3E971_9FIRM|nr:MULTISPECIES: Stp1/IreP family PP2C-type Ser/Thr phosphatase [Pseudobutyrivibrio]MBR5953599.1 Stp1/IreP family PP2C-type Ser/Thr phosphatase [Pseudobutyrivibrio sp.]NEX02677.1 Stp1/IreP family PP2C-type Ser/Thr phosphatase [Pseudobutyrivibrio xylanivorans]PHU35871.1 serine/threonine-protein phosphatase [Pseudobutyrivibrio ruminis]PHU39673.1 serine/threonine-protein phosphatase [Pseudobutyrivibrio ruminis]SCY02525.1 protein phosphatase [Pseudobutyrivibrio sp. AR14]